jgi:protein arginine N-methyltransferase 5
MCLSNTNGTPRDSALEQKAEVWRSGAAPFQLDEVVLQRMEEGENVIAFASDWIHLDSPDEWVRYDSELALMQEIGWAVYLNLSVLILPTPRHREQIASYGRAVNAGIRLLATSQLQLSVQIPIYDPHVKLSLSTSAVTPFESHGLSWEMWDAIRSICNYHTKLSLSKVDQAITIEIKF